MILKSNGKSTSGAATTFQNAAAPGQFCTQLVGILLVVLHTIVSDCLHASLLGGSTLHELIGLDRHAYNRQCLEHDA